MHVKSPKFLKTFTEEENCKTLFPLERKNHLNLRNSLTLYKNRETTSGEKCRSGTPKYVENFLDRKRLRTEKLKVPLPSLFLTEITVFLGLGFSRNCRVLNNRAEARGGYVVHFFSFVGCFSSLN